MPTAEPPFLPRLSDQELRGLADHFNWRLPAINKVEASAETKLDAIEAAGELGVTVPRCGIKLEDLDYALCSYKMATPPSVDERMRLKNRLANAGLLIESKATDARERAYFTGCIAQKKLGLDVRPYTVAELNKHFAKSNNLSTTHRTEIKAILAAAGLLKSDAVRVPPPKPNAAAVRHICASIDLDPPLPGAKLSLAAVNKALKATGFENSRSADIKSRLNAAGALE
jgi:hypothetical protein